MEPGHLAKAMNWTTNYLNGIDSNVVVGVKEVKVRDHSLFIECTKQYIDWYGGIEFNSDYSKFRRIQRVRGNESSD